jgi:hypothetical protein
MAIRADDQLLQIGELDWIGDTVRKMGDRFVPFYRCGQGRYHHFRHGTILLNFATRAEATAFCRDFRDRMEADAPEEYVSVVTPGGGYPLVRGMQRKHLCSLCIPSEWVFEDRQKARRVAQRLHARLYMKWHNQAYPEKAQARRISKPDRRALYAEWEASGRHCGICGEVVAEGQPTHIDHVLPVADGGTRDRANLRVTHQHCNATRYWREWRERKSCSNIRSKPRHARIGQTTGPWV